MKKKITFLIIASIVLVLMSCDSITLTVTFSPYAYIIDEEGEPITGVYSALYNSSDQIVGEKSTSNSSGRVSFGTVDKGTYTLKTWLPSTWDSTRYTFVNQQITIEDGINYLGRIVGIQAQKVTLTGKVIDAKIEGSNNSISNATVTVKQGNSTVQTATTNSSGEFTISNLAPGQYTVSTAKAANSTTKIGYTFIDKKIDISSDTNVGSIIGFAYHTINEVNDLSFIVMWNDTFADVDIHLTYPDDNRISALTHTFTTPYAYPSTPAGFAPETDSTSSPNRDTVYWNYSTNVQAASQLSTKGSYDFDSDRDGTMDSYKIELDVDDKDGRGPETITVKSFPYSYSGYTGASTTGGGETALPQLTGTGDYYAWTGVMEVYIDAYNSELNMTASGTNDYLSTVSTNGDSADAVLYVLDGAQLKGIYTVPTYTDVKQASMVRINMFHEYDNNIRSAEVFQILPDLKIIPTDAGMKSAGQNSPIVVTKRPIK